MMEEMREYVKLLARLDEQGFNCKKELQEALKALHELMGFKSNNGITIKDNSVGSSINVGKGSATVNQNDVKNIINKFKEWDKPL